MDRSDLESLGITKLKEIAKARGIENYSQYRSNTKHQLIDLILASPTSRPTLRSSSSARPSSSASSARPSSSASSARPTLRSSSSARPTLRSSSSARPSSSASSARPAPTTFSQFGFLPFELQEKIMSFLPDPDKRTVKTMNPDLRLTLDEPQTVEQAKSLEDKFYISHLIVLQDQQIPPELSYVKTVTRLPIDLSIYILLLIMYSNNELKATEIVSPGMTYNRSNFRNGLKVDRYNYDPPKIDLREERITTISLGGRPLEDTIRGYESQIEKLLELEPRWVFTLPMILKTPPLNFNHHFQDFDLTHFTLPVLDKVVLERNFTRDELIQGLLATRRVKFFDNRITSLSIDPVETRTRGVLTFDLQYENM